MIVYQYSHEGFYEGEEQADTSPLEPGVFLIPARCTDIPPPLIPLEDYQRFWWDGDCWQVVEIDTDAMVIAKLRNFLSANPDVMALISRPS